HPLGTRNADCLLPANRWYRPQPLPSLSSRYAAADLRYTAGARSPGESLMYHDLHILIAMRDRCSCTEPMRCLGQSPRPPHLLTLTGPTLAHRLDPVRPQSGLLRVTHPPNSFEIGRAHV